MVVVELGVSIFIAAHMTTGIYRVEPIVAWATQRSGVAVG
jgi:hypothetical protein